MYKLVRSYGIQNLRNLKNAPSLAGVQNVRKFTKVPSPNELPRPAGISSMFRLPVKENAKGKDQLYNAYYRLVATWNYRLFNFAKCILCLTCLN